VARLLVADGSSQIYRAFHAMARGAGRALTADDGTPTGALLGFLQILRKAIRDYAPDHVAVAFDRSEPTFRHERFPEYKAQRDAMPEDLQVQLKLAKDALAALRVPVLELSGWEADDVIATLTRRARERGEEVVILSSDKDLLQLVGEGVALHHTVRDRLLDAEGAEEVYGLPPERVRDYLAIVGDASDNVPGVKGIGDKGARELVRAYGDLDAILASRDEIAGNEALGRTRKRMAKLLAEQEDAARLAWELIGLADDAPLAVDFDALAVTEPDREACAELFGKLGFHRLLDELGVDGPAGAETADAASVEADYRVAATRTELEALAEGLRAAGRFALDTETDALDPHVAGLVGISVSRAPGEGAYVPLGTPEGEPRADAATVQELLGPVLADAALEKVLQNAKYDLCVLERHDLSVQGVEFDTMIASYLLDSSRRSHGLDALAADHLGYRTIAYSELAGTGKEQVTLDRVPVSAVARYAAEDADVTLRLSELFRPRLVDAGVERVFREIEMPLVPVLTRMELAGVKVDADVLASFSEELEVRLGGLEREIHASAGREFSVSSPKQLAEVLFDELGLKPRGRTAKTGARSTAVDVLEQLAVEHPLPALVLEYRELSKLKGTYVDVLPKLINPETGRVHTTYNQSVAATGRLSSQDPNLQNIPIRTELGRRIREAFVAEPGHLLVGADYSQVELRIMAHLSGDEALCRAFREGEDIHRRTAAEVFDVMPDLVTDDLRRRAKEVNFGVLYGMGAHGLAQRLGIRRTEAQGIIDRYFDRLPRVRETIDRLVEAVREDPRHEARTLFGRARALPDIASRSHAQRSFAERAAVNTVMQGTAADLIKLAMIRLDERLRAESPGSRLILQVHDELVVEAPEAEAEAVRELVVDAMENVHELRIPLEVVASVGGSWYQLK
jgi:DNA polymerase-1